MSQSLSEVKFPFDTYDFFGYLIPGFSVFALYFVFELFVLKPATGSCYIAHMTITLPLYGLVEYAAQDGLGWPVQAGLIIASVVGCYAMGHIISAFSSLFIDRLLVRKVYGYPHETLVPPFDSEEAKTYRESTRFSSTNARYYMAAFTWVNLYLVLRLSSVLNPEVALLKSGLAFAEWFLIISTIVKILFSFVAHRLSEATKGKGWWKGVDSILGVAYFLFAFPYYVASTFLAKVTNTRGGFDPNFREQFNKCYSNQDWPSKSTSTSNRFWLPFIFVSDKAPALGAMITHWLHLYSFARNLAAGCYISFVLMIIALSVYKRCIIESNLSAVGWIIPMLALVLSAAMLIRFYYLYYCYYSKFTFRAFIYLATKK